MFTPDEFADASAELADAARLERASVVKKIWAEKILTGEKTLQIRRNAVGEHLWNRRVGVSISKSFQIQGSVFG